MKQYVMNVASGEAFGPSYVGPSLITDAKYILIAGYRDSHFAFLQDIRPGHTIETGHYRGRTGLYKVIDISIIDSNIEQIPLNNEHNLITLVRCFPF
jgi:sortase A